MKPYILSILLLSALSSSAQTTISEKDGNLILTDKGTNVVLSGPVIGQKPAIYNNKVYVLKIAEDEANNKIVAYDINTKQPTDIITIGMKTEDGYVVKTNITNMQVNTSSGRLYFTTKDVYNGNSIHLTWTYDLNNGQYKVFSDGRLNNIDHEGNINVIFDGGDPKGRFIRKAYYTPDRTLIRIDEKEYQ